MISPTLPIGSDRLTIAPDALPIEGRHASMARAGPS